MQLMRHIRKVKPKRIKIWEIGGKQGNSVLVQLNKNIRTVEIVRKMAVFLYTIAGSNRGQPDEKRGTQGRGI